MRDDNAATEAGRRYATAHAAHYQAKDLRKALGLYMAIVVAHPRSLEAGYSRSQIENIVRSLVPEQVLLEAEVEMAIARLETVE